MKLKLNLCLKKGAKGFFTLAIVAPIIAMEFKLEVIPHITTIAKWQRQVMEAVDADIKDLREQLRIEQWTYLQKLLVKWMPIATADHLEVQRWKREEGSLQPFMTRTM